MSKDRPTPDKIANELSGASAFFRKPAPAPETPPPAAPTPVAPDPAEAPSQPDVTTSRRQVGAHPLQSEAFDINRETASHDTLRLSLDETRALEDLKSALKWDHDLTVSKNDICRVALHALIEDYRTKGAGSSAVKRLKRKLGRR